MLDLCDGSTAEDFVANYTQSITEALERRELAREPLWTESIAVGSQPFVRKVSEETQNRVALESQESQPGMWTVREPGCAYA